MSCLAAGVRRGDEEVLEPMRGYLEDRGTVPVHMTVESREGFRERAATVPNVFPERRSISVAQNGAGDPPVSREQGVECICWNIYLQIVAC